MLNIIVGCLSPAFREFIRPKKPCMNVFPRFRIPEESSAGHLAADCECAHPCHHSHLQTWPAGFWSLQVRWPALQSKPSSSPHLIPPMWATIVIISVWCCWYIGICNRLCKLMHLLTHFLDIISTLWPGVKLVCDVFGTIDFSYLVPS